MLFKFLNLEYQVNFSIQQATDNDGEGRTLTPPPTNSINTYIDYNIGLDDMFDIHQVLSPQLASSSTKPMDSNSPSAVLPPSRPKIEPIPKKSKKNIPETKGRRWTWNDEKVDTLMDQIIEYKSQRSYEGYDFEAYLVIMFSDLRKMMSLLYPPSDFGLEELEMENSEGMTRADLLI